MARAEVRRSDGSGLAMTRSNVRAGYSPANLLHPAWFLLLCGLKIFFDIVR
jgi:hypothetical protein